MACSPGGNGPGGKCPFVRERLAGLTISPSIGNEKLTSVEMGKLPANGFPPVPAVVTPKAVARPGNSSAQAANLVVCWVNLQRRCDVDIRFLGYAAM